MQLYTGTKTIGAKPMTRGEYNAYRDWKAPEGEDQSAPGYLVEYMDGGKANDSRHTGYISWSPADVFEKAYRESGTFEQRVRNELADRTAELDRLNACCDGPEFEKIDGTSQMLLLEQRSIMTQFVHVLSRRVDNFSSD